MRINVLIFLALMHIGCSNKKEEKPKDIIYPNIELAEAFTNFVAGQRINLTFKTKADTTNLKLKIKNAYGTVILPPELLGKSDVVFSIPVNYTRIAGPCRWALLFNGHTIRNGKFDIGVNTDKATHLESYFGPRSVTAGFNDYSMLTVSPTDVYDNPLDNDTEVNVKYQFLENITDQQISTENFIAWYNVASTLISGRILVTSECNGTTSKELATIVYPSNAVNFSIGSSSAHNFADGNQIVTFTSDIIRDEFGNTVIDGTLVTFVIKNEKDFYLYTIGTTINGIAKAKTLHPDRASNWQIQAFVTGSAESNTIEFNFQTAIKDYQVHFSKGNRNIVVGPFESFMKQLVPDGILMQLDIYNLDGIFIESKKTTSKDGVCSIFLGEHFLPEGDYVFNIKAAGITKKFTKSIDGDTIK